MKRIYFLVFPARWTQSIVIKFLFTEDLNSGVRNTLKVVFPKHLWEEGNEGLEARRRKEGKRNELWPGNVTVNHIESLRLRSLWGRDAGPSPASCTVLASGGSGLVHQSNK